MITDLIGQHVKEGWQGEEHYQRIVAVYLDRGVLKLVTVNPDDNLVIRDAEHCKVAPRIPSNNTSFQCHTCQCWSDTLTEAEECCS